MGRPLTTDMELGLIVRCLCAGCIGFVLGVFVLNIGSDSASVQEPATDMVAMPQLMTKNAILFGGLGQPSAYGGYFPKVGEDKSGKSEQQSFMERKQSLERSYSAPPAVAPASMSGLSPEQQAFMARKMKETGSAAHSFTASSSPSYSSRPATSSSFSSTASTANGAGYHKSYSPSYHQQVMS